MYSCCFLYYFFLFCFRRYNIHIHDKHSNGEWRSGKMFVIIFLDICFWETLNENISEIDEIKKNFSKHLLWKLKVKDLNFVSETNSWTGFLVSFFCFNLKRRKIFHFHENPKKLKRLTCTSSIQMASFSE